MAASGVVHLIVKYGSKWALNEGTNMTRTEAAVASTALGVVAGTITGLLTTVLTAGVDPVAGIGMAIGDAFLDPDLTWSDATDSGSGNGDVHFSGRYEGVDRWGNPVEAGGLAGSDPQLKETGKPVQDPGSIRWNG